MIGLLEETVSEETRLPTEGVDTFCIIGAVIKADWNRGMVYLFEILFKGSRATYIKHIAPARTVFLAYTFCAL